MIFFKQPVLCFPFGKASNAALSNWQWERGPQIVVKCSVHAAAGLLQCERPSQTVKIRFQLAEAPRPSRANSVSGVVNREKTEIAAHGILVTSDSDVEVAPNYLREVVPPLLDPQVGAVTCVFRGKSAGGPWAALDAIGMSVEFTAGVLIANFLEGMKFGLGPTIALRKDSIARIGGYAAVREYLSNDFVVGNFIQKAGFRVVLSSHIVDHVSPPMTFRQMWERQLRWAMGTRYSRPKGHLGTGLTFAVPYGILALVAASLLGHPAFGGALFAAALLNRMAECWIVGWWAARDPLARRAAFLYPLRDLHAFIVWCASYFRKRCLWRDNNYELLKGGRLVARRANGSVVGYGQVVVHRPILEARTQGGPGKRVDHLD